jgi:hypothetical protein
MALRLALPHQTRRERAEMAKNGLRSPKRRKKDKAAIQTRLKPTRAMLMASCIELTADYLKVRTALRDLLAIYDRGVTIPKVFASPKSGSWPNEPVRPALNPAEMDVNSFDEVRQQIEAVQVFERGDQAEDNAGKDQQRADAHDQGFEKRAENLGAGRIHFTSSSRPA